MRRSRSTVYQWIADGMVRTMRPGRVLWVNVPDLLATEQKMIPGRKKSKILDISLEMPDTS